MSAKRGTYHVPEADRSFNAVLGKLSLLEIGLPSCVELSAVEQEVSSFQENVDIVTYDLEEVDKLAISIIVHLYRARRFVEEERCGAAEDLNVCDVLRNHSQERWYERLLSAEIR